MIEPPPYLPPPYLPLGLSITCATHQAAEAHGWTYRETTVHVELVTLYGRHGCNGYIRDKTWSVGGPLIKRCTCPCHVR